MPVAAFLKSKDVSIHHRAVENAVGHFKGGLIRNLQVNSIGVPILGRKEGQYGEAAVRFFRNRCVNSGDIIDFVVGILNQLEQRILFIHIRRIGDFGMNFHIGQLGGIAIFFYNLLQIFVVHTHGINPQVQRRGIRAEILDAVDSVDVLFLVTFRDVVLVKTVGAVFERVEEGNQTIHRFLGIGCARQLLRELFVFIVGIRKILLVVILEILNSVV